LIGDLDPRQLFVDTDMLVRFDFAEVIEDACIKRKLATTFVGER
jgi:hypothetical protein